MAHINRGSVHLYSCKICSPEEYMDNDFVLDHMERNHQTVVQCERCGEFFHGKALLQHIIRAHRQTVLSCRVCHRLVGWQAVLDVHMKAEHLDHVVRVDQLSADGASWIWLLLRLL